MDPTALRMLHESMEHSLGLQDDEHRAMRLVAEATGLPRERMPQHLLDVALTPEEKALSPAEKRQRAVDMLYDESYFAAKSNIWDSAARFLDGTIGRTVDDFDETTKRTIRSVARQMVLFTLALAVVFALLVIAASVGYALFSRLNRTNLALVAELRRERDATLAAEKAKSMFFSMVSHDIRTPLNSIIGFSEMLRDGVADPAERADHVENILFSSHTLLALVNDVLDLSKLDAEKMKFSYAPCDFPALLGRVAASFRIQTARKGIGLRADCGAMPRLLLDEERLRQVLVNLVGNAVKFTDEGSVELRAAFARARCSAADMIRFGSMLEDLECYVDNSVVWSETEGRIVGRHGGIRQWLRENAPDLYERYKTVMKYKALARRFRQAVGVADPVPASAVLPPQLPGKTDGEGMRTGDGTGIRRGGDKEGDSREHCSEQSRGRSEGSCAEEGEQEKAMAGARERAGVLLGRCEGTVASLAAQLERVLSPEYVGDGCDENTVRTEIARNEGRRQSSA
ncbi:MAG: hypothetical protein IJ146_13515 [Kiritimatiellae bacterium]|nr:hypothetical protein [Kiritimatiellia bacterium]